MEPKFKTNKGWHLEEQKSIPKTATGIGQRDVVIWEGTWLWAARSSAGAGAVAGPESSWEKRNKDLGCQRSDFGRHTQKVFIFYSPLANTSPSGTELQRESTVLVFQERQQAVGHRKRDSEHPSGITHVAVKDVQNQLGTLCGLDLDNSLSREGPAVRVTPGDAFWNDNCSITASH